MSKKDESIRKISSLSSKYGDKLLQLMNYYNVTNLKSLNEEEIEYFYKNILGGRE